MYDASSFVNVSEPLRLGNLAHFYYDAFELKDDMFRYDDMFRVCISGYRYLYIYITAVALDAPRSHVIRVLNWSKSAGELQET